MDFALETDQVVDDVPPKLGEKAARSVAAAKICPLKLHLCLRGDVFPVECGNDSRKRECPLHTSQAR